MAESGFFAPVLDAQRIFRTLLAAFSEPGRVIGLEPMCVPPPPLDPVAAAIALTLCDGDTPVWLADPLVVAAEFIRFQTGAPITPAPGSAQFALADCGHRPPLSALNQGTPEYPDRAATLIVTVAALEEGRGWQLSGPGIPGRRSFLAHGIDTEFAPEWRENGARFPLGVDIVFAAGSRLAALPRSTRLEV